MSADREVAATNIEPADAVVAAAGTRHASEGKSSTDALTQPGSSLLQPGSTAC